MPVIPILPLSEDDRGHWKTRIADAVALIELQKGRWETNLKRYAPPIGETREGINTNKDFTQAEAKKAAIFYDTPEIGLTAKPGYEPMAAAISQRQSLLNALIGPERADVKQAEHLALIDALVPSGFGVFKIGYRATTVPVEQPAQVDPLTGAEMAPATTVDVPIYEEHFYDRVSPRALLVSSEQHAVHADKAPWIGLRFQMPKRTTIREYQLTAEQAEDLQTGQGDEFTFNAAGVPKSGKPSDMASGVEVWYQAAIFDDGVVHPQKIRELVFLDGLDEPVRHRDSPYQQFDRRGRLLPQSMVGYPIDLSSFRDLPDSPWVPSDSTMTRQLIDELNLFRTQMCQGRQSNKPKTLYDVGKFPPETLEKLEKGEVGDMIGVAEGTLAAGVATIMAQVVTASEPRQNYDAQGYIERDLDNTLALGANQTGAMSQTTRSATEVQTVQSNATARLQQERKRWLEGTLRRLRKFDALVQLFPIQSDLDAILGLQAAHAYLKVAPSLAGAFTYSIKPDSGVFIDAVQDRQQALSLYNLLRQDPLCNPSALLDAVLRKHNLDPTKVIVQPQKPGPPPPAVSYRFSGADFVGPQAPIVAAIAAQAGLQIDPALLQQGMHSQEMLGALSPPKQGEMPPGAEHGGVAPKAEPMDAHQMHLTGGTQGIAGGGPDSRGGFGA